MGGIAEERMPVVYFSARNLQNTPLKFKSREVPLAGFLTPLPGNRYIGAQPPGNHPFFSPVLNDELVD